MPSVIEKQADLDGEPVSERFAVRITPAHLCTRDKMMVKSLK
jgi:hypothetical protein